MGCFIVYKDDSIMYNNHQFYSSFKMAIEYANGLEESVVSPYLEKMSELIEYRHHIQIEKDFNIDESKFWAKIFHDVARKIFEKKIGVHEYNFWQTSRIFQLYGTGNLFEKAVREVESNWISDSIDNREYEEYRNQSDVT